MSAPDCLLISYAQYLRCVPYLNAGFDSITAFRLSFREPAYFGFLII